jgi:hypothetical protein
MKKVITLLLITVIALTVKAQQNGHTDWQKKRYEHFKERTISRSFPASGNTLSIDNSFGDVTIIASSGNEIKVDIHIEASSSNKEHAERTYENLDVKESREGNTISFKTITEKNKGGNNYCKNCQTTMNISYTVQMPVSTGLKIQNQFGGIKLPDYSGNLSLDIKFGSLTTGSLTKVEKLLVEFSKVTIKNLSNVNATFKFSTIVIENLSGTNSVKVEFCGSTRINLDNDLTGLNLNDSYSTVNLRPAANLSASFRIRTSFGSIKNRSNISMQRTDKPDQYGPDSDKEFEGKSGSGSAKIEIKSSFGTIIIGEATAEEIKDKKDKEKNKVKI